MKPLLILMLFLIGCSSKEEEKAAVKEQASECWAMGGDRYEIGISGGSDHRVCVFIRMNYE